MRGWCKEKTVKSNMVPMEHDLGPREEYFLPDTKENAISVLFWFCRQDTGVWCEVNSR